jgi:hypothetical protein
MTATTTPRPQRVTHIPAPVDAGALSTPRTHRWTNALGTAIVAVCLLVPSILGSITDQIEATATSAYLQALPSTDPAPVPLAARDYYLVCGCVSNPIDCGKSNRNSWGEYYTELSRLYAGETAAVYEAPGFPQWAADHVHYVSVQTAADGPDTIADALAANTTARSIHLIGTSAGGAALVSYLSRAMRGAVAPDPRVRAALIVDAPLGFAFPLRWSNLLAGVEAGAMKTDVAPGLGTWLQQWHIAIFAVDTPYDLIEHDPIPGVPADPAPLYPDSDAPPRSVTGDGCRGVLCPIVQARDTLMARIAWHNYTGNHMPQSAQDFIGGQWGK